MDEDEDEDGGLFNITISSDEESQTQEKEPKLPRDHQSESDFQNHLKTWRPKVETEELWKGLKLPIDKPSKPESQVILHAIEELYFQKRYQEALSVVEKALEGEELIGDFRGVLERYRRRCEGRLRVT